MITPTQETTWAESKKSPLQFFQCYKEIKVLDKSSIFSRRFPTSTTKTTFKKKTYTILFIKSLKIIFLRTISLSISSPFLRTSSTFSSFYI